MNGLDISAINNPNIESISSSGDSCIFIHFKNKYELSVISGMGAYSSSDKPFEIAVFKGEMINYFNGNLVLGYLTTTEVISYINEISSI